MNSAITPAITSDSAIRFGTPCIAGTRISVADVLGYISAGDSVETIIANFPELTEEKIRAALKYASDVPRGWRYT